jgi:predicted nucleotidyltransferase
MLPEDLKQLLLAFNDHKVEYLIVGGYAVAIYAEPRATKDLDLFIRPESANSERVYSALAAYGVPMDGLTAADFTEPGAIFQLGVAPARIDILPSIDGVTFDEAWHQRVEVMLDGVAAHVISSAHLMQNKLRSGRTRDLADVEAIRLAIELARKSDQQK